MWIVFGCRKRKALVTKCTMPLFKISAYCFSVPSYLKIKVYWDGMSDRQLYGSRHHFTVFSPCPLPEVKTVSAKQMLNWDGSVSVVWGMLNFSASCESWSPRQLSFKFLDTVFLFVFYFNWGRDEAEELGPWPLCDPCGQAGYQANTGKWWESLSHIQILDLHEYFQLQNKSEI